MTEEYDDHPELGFLLTRLSEVLAGAHAAGREVEDCYGDLIRAFRTGDRAVAGSATSSHPGPRASLQELDRLVQVLDNLARFTAALASEVPEGQRISTATARRQILLRDLAMVLLGQPGMATVIRAGNGNDIAAGGAEADDGLHLF